MISDKSKLTVKELGPPDEDTLARAARSILLLPLNWGSGDKEPVYAVSTESVAKLLTQKSVPLQTLSPVTTETRLKDERAMDWVAPTLFVSGLYVVAEPNGDKSRIKRNGKLRYGPFQRN